MDSVSGRTNADRSAKATRAVGDADADEHRSAIAELFEPIMIGSSSVRWPVRGGRRAGRGKSEAWADFGNLYR